MHADASTRDLLKPEAVWEFERCQRLSGADVHRASRARSAWYRAVLDLFGRHDFLLLPAAQVFPFDAKLHWPASVAGRPMDTYHRWLQVAVPATMAGLPALAVPAGRNPQGLPAGLQIIGPPQGDFTTLQLGHAYDLAAGMSCERPPLTKLCLDQNAPRS